MSTLSMADRLALVVAWHGSIGHVSNDFGKVGTIVRTTEGYRVWITVGAAECPVPGTLPTLALALEGLE